MIPYGHLPGCRSGSWGRWHCVEGCPFDECQERAIETTGLTRDNLALLRWIITEQRRRRNLDTSPRGDAQ